MTPAPGALLSAAVLLPLSGALACLLWPRAGRGLCLALAPLLVAVAVLLVRTLLAQGPLTHPVGGWGAPLGIELEVDGIAALLLLTTALVGLAVVVYAQRYFGAAEGRFFWPLWLLLWGGLDALFVSADLFNLYVTLELVGLAAVALTAQAGGAAALTAALRYLLVTFLASLTYLLGVALLYHHAGTLDLTLLGQRLQPVSGVWLGLGLVSAALVLKSALFPLHFWLPPAHSNAPAPVSAVLSALVVVASFYVLMRLWLEAMPPERAWLGRLLGGLGACAIVWGSLQALRQRHLKLLVAYSTAAQLGYLFLPFALVSGPAAATAWRGALYFLFCHALAKAAMFLAAGNIQKFAGHDRIADLDKVVYPLPLSVAAFGAAGLTLIGLPPSGGFVAKWLLLEAAVAERQWWLVVVIAGGGLLTAAYVFRVVGSAFTPGRVERAPRQLPATLEWVALALALSTVLLGFVMPAVLELIEVGQPFETRS